MKEMKTGSFQLGTLEMCFSLAIWDANTLSLLHTTLQMVQVRTELASAPVSINFCFFTSRSCAVTTWFVFFFFTYLSKLHKNFGNDFFSWCGHIENTNLSTFYPFHLLLVFNNINN